MYEDYTPQTETTPQEATPGYKIVMPNEEIPTQETNKNDTEEVAITETPQNELGYKIVMPDEAPSTDTTTAENNNEPVPEATTVVETPTETTPPIQENYTVAAVQNGLDTDGPVEILTKYELEPVVDDSITEEEQEETENPKESEITINNYIDNNDDEPIEPTIEIKGVQTSPTQQQLEKLDSKTEPAQQSFIPEITIPNIQAVSAVPEVSDNPAAENSQEQTGSNLLTDPGIRIAEDGNINNQAEINAEPILPNYN